MQSCSRAVTAIFIMLLSVNAVADPAEILDDEDEIRSEVQDFVHFFIEEPGHLVVDASENRTIFPLRNDPLVFADRAEYDQFLEVVLGAKFSVDVDGNPVVDLATTVIGRPITYSSDLSSLVPVEDPVVTLIGGRTGIVEVGGESFCVNESLCTDVVGPLTLLPKVEALPGEDDSTLLELQSNSLQVQVTQPFSSTFKIGAEQRYKGYGTGTAPQEANVTVIVKQLLGGFQVLETKWVPAKITCGWEPNFIGALKWVCWVTPNAPVVVKSKGSNRLDATFYSYANVYYSHFRLCQLEQVKRGGDWDYNIPQLYYVDRSTFPGGSAWTLRRRQVNPLVIVGDHEGEDLKTKEYEHIRLRKTYNNPQECR